MSLYHWEVFMTNQEKEILNVQAAADFLGVKVSTIRYWVFIKKIPFIKYGDSSSTVRFRRSDLIQWMKDHSHKPEK